MATVTLPFDTSRYPLPPSRVLVGRLPISNSPPTSNPALSPATSTDPTASRPSGTPSPLRSRLPSPIVIVPCSSKPDCTPTVSLPSLPNTRPALARTLTAVALASAMLVLSRSSAESPPMADGTDLGDQLFALNQSPPSIFVSTDAPCAANGGSNSAPTMAPTLNNDAIVWWRGTGR